MSDVRLADPTQSDEIVLEIGNVPPGRPVMFGDVFRDVPCMRGGAPEELVMILSHPCSMRGSGGTLKARVLTARIAEFPHKLRPEKWASGYFDHFPVFGLGSSDRTPHAVDLGELHAAKSDDLDVERRVVALSDYGVTVLLQRWIFQMSRDPVPLGDLDALIAPVMAEAELQEMWCEAARTRARFCDEKADMESAARTFQDFLGKRGDGGLRDQLQYPAKTGDVRRVVRAEIRKRFET